MIDKKKTIQIFLLFSAILILSSVYIVYFSYPEKKISSNKVKKVDLEDKSEFSNVLKDITYSTIDNKNNVFKIYSKSGEIDINNSNIIYMKEVTATISLNKTKS